MNRSRSGARRTFRFVVYRARDGWRWSLVAGNGKTIADSAEGYRRKAHAIRMAELLRSSQQMIFSTIEVQE